MVEQLALFPVALKTIGPSIITCCACGESHKELVPYTYETGETFVLHGEEIPVKAYAFRCLECHEKDLPSLFSCARTPDVQREDDS